MNKLETKAYDWLKQNYDLNDDQIIFHKNTSPDFSTTIGDFEVKKVTGKRYIFFTEKQVRDLANNVCTILIFEAEANEPIEFTFDQTKKHYKIVLTNPRDQIRIYASVSLLKALQEKYPETKGMTCTCLVNWALRKLIEVKP